MSAPAAIVEVDTGARHLVNGVVAYRVLAGHRHLDAGDLLFEPAEIDHGVVLDESGGRIVVGFRAGRPIAARHIVVEVLGPAANRAQEADHRDAARAYLLEVASDDGVIPVAAAHEDAVATDLIEKAGFAPDVLGIAHEYRAGSGDGPVSLEQGLVGLAEQGTVGARERETLEGYGLDRRRG
jgi:hypothetical protein